MLDILMPDVSGLEVLERVRAFSQIPVIIFSANPRVVEEAMRIEASGSINKPFNPDQLLQKISKVLNGNGTAQV